ncbi:hypothetical protein AMET1_1000 [Methanonatronarchaeum thermophilum]|uniref:Uncharacterized protein n=1 Tax=Methanonatronarchaeum thermophilum TaxID=1927129 RepID=A0A1Y3G9V0_9EURY|nr:hypothetical protein [Methanonatronarchaeum thermophilum]OUJ18047.1 hypothetical protein AMET1_1540 [Methanonatronarchaeum thermophilum]OUJ18103.1 hypothetical protein AMET1_1000 [Methanonatronarchaeum thermophilum]
MEPPEIKFKTDTEAIIEMNETAKMIIENPEEAKEIEDIFTGIISLKMFLNREVKTPIKTKNGQMLATIQAEKNQNHIKTKLPFEKNKWLKDMVTAQKQQIYEIEASSTAIKQINKAEKRLKQSTDFHSHETILLRFSDIDEFNKLSLQLKDKNNVKIEETKTIKDEIIAQIEIIPPTIRWI